MAPQAHHPTVVFFLGKLLGKTPRDGIKYEVDWDDGVVAWHPARDLLTLDAVHDFVCLGNKKVLVEKVAGKICVYCDGHVYGATAKEVAESEEGDGGEQSEESSAGDKTKESNGGRESEESNGGPEGEVGDGVVAEQEENDSDSSVEEEGAQEKDELLEDIRVQNQPGGEGEAAVHPHVHTCIHMHTRTHMHTTRTLALLTHGLSHIPPMSCWPYTREHTTGGGGPKLRGKRRARRRI